MKLLFDENLSRNLVARLDELYPGSAHVAAFDLLACPDREIWDFARAKGFIIVTTDADFYELAAALGPPPKVIWLRRWTHPTWDTEFVPRRDAIRITEFAADPSLWAVGAGPLLNQCSPVPKRKPTYGE